MIRRPPSTNGNASNRAAWPNAVSPTRTAVPPGGSAAIACSIVAGSPIASNTKSGPPSPAASRMPSTTASGFAGSACTQCVAPSVPARSIFARLTSTAMIRRAPASYGAHHARQPDAAEADHRDGRARRHLGGLDHGAHARRHAAADQRRDLGRHAVGHRDHRGRRHDLGRRHRADREVGEDRRAVGAGEARRAVGLGVAQRRRSGAQPLATALALAAAQARRVPGEGDRAADDGRVEPRSDGLDDAGALVAEHDRPRPLPVAVADVEVGMADARRRHPHEDLARARVVEAQGLDGADGARPLDDGRLGSRACPYDARSAPCRPIPCSGGRRDAVDRRPDHRSRIAAVVAPAPRLGRRSRPSSSTWTADSAST